MLQLPLILSLCMQPITACSVSLAVVLTAPGTWQPAAALAGVLFVVVELLFSHFASIKVSSLCTRVSNAVLQPARAGVGSCNCCHSHSSWQATPSQSQPPPNASCCPLHALQEQQRAGKKSQQ